MIRKATYMVILLLIAGGFYSCKKDKVPMPPEPTRWEKISGTYKVYDTTGVYLYEMKISHIQGSANTGDTLDFQNFGGKFSFKSYQGLLASNYPETYLKINPDNPTKDVYGKRWQLYGITDNKFLYNTVWDDTIVLRYRTINILYYISDLTPYCDSIFQEVAIKQ